MEASKKEPNVLQTYEELKTYFEKYACRVDNVLLYPVLDTNNERTLYTSLQLKERFSHLKYLEGKTEHKFVQEWADDPNKKAFRKMDVVPKDCPPDVYNLWERRRTWKRPTPRGIFLKSTVWRFKDVNSFS